VVGVEVAYFAYGSNMWSEQMLGRCPTATAPVVASLEGWRLLINERGVATLIRDAEGEVHGVLWRLGDVDLRTLDLAEGVADGRYDRLTVGVVTVQGASVQAEVYVDPRCTPGPARDGYRERLISGAVEHGLPDAYRTFLDDA
jgi:gamma-glutamylcyclotransferase (GGCT)/AIG2-like uncharacterized protein YtfP